jgi:hypothetical protein
MEQRNFMGSWSLVQWTTHSHTETAINEKIYGRDEKFVTAFEQKKSAITTHFQPLRVTLHELLYLCLGESETIEFDAQAAKHILKCAVADYFMDLHSSFFSRRSDSDYIAIPMVEIRINVAEDVRSSRKRFVTIGWIDHQSLASGNISALNQLWLKLFAFSTLWLGFPRLKDRCLLIMIRLNSLFSVVKPAPKRFCGFHGPSAGHDALDANVFI